MYRLVSSNEEKLNEYRKFGLPMLELEKGTDLPEVDSEPLEVVIHKALSVRVMRMVEETSLLVEGENAGVNIRWLLDQLTNFVGRKAGWEVLLGVHRAETVDVYRGYIEGTITNRFSEPVGFEFDAFFIPEGETLTLYELEKIGRKDEFSARKLAVEAFLKEKRYHQKKVYEIPIWKRNY